MQPIPVSMVSGGEILTRITFTLSNINIPATYGYSAGSIEDQTDGDGGNPVGTSARWSSVSGVTVIDLDISSLGLLWSNRYNYRIGGVNAYYLTGLFLYKNGAVGESQNPMYNLMGAFEYSLTSGYWGMNIDPGNRNGTRYITKYGGGGFAIASYPK